MDLSTRRTHHKLPGLHPATAKCAACRLLTKATLQTAGFSMTAAEWGLRGLHGNKHTIYDGFAGCIQIIARLHSCITTLRMFIAAGFAFIAGHSTRISTCEVCIAEVAMTIAGYKKGIALGEMLISLFYAAISSYFSVISVHKTVVRASIEDLHHL